MLLFLNKLLPNLILTMPYNLLTLKKTPINFRFLRELGLARDHLYCNFRCVFHTWSFNFNVRFK